MRLKDRVAFLTAAAGAGIGQATARAMAEEGAKIVVTDAHGGRAAGVAEAIQKDLGVEALGLGCDVRDRQAVEGAVSLALDRFGGIDILFTNAGINTLSPVVSMSDETWDRVIDTCLRGTFYACRAVLPTMMAGGRGRIITVASMNGFMGLSGGEAHYSAAKAGVMAFTRCLAMEMAPHRITANSIAPGYIHNPFMERIYAPEELRKLAEAIPYPRKGTPRDIANIAVFLATDEAEYLTGQTLCASGGSWMH